MSEIRPITPSVQDLHAAWGPPEPGELPEVAVYRNTDRLVMAAQQFDKNPDDPEAQTMLLGSQEALRGSFSLFVSKLIGDRLFDRSALPSVIGTVFRHNLEERRYAMKRIFPEAEFSEIENTKSETVRNITLDFLGIYVRGLTDEPTKAVASKIAKKFYLDISEDVQAAFKAKDLHHKDAEEPTHDDLRDIEHEDLIKQEEEIEDITSWMSEQDYIASMAAMYRSGAGNVEQIL